MLTTVKLYGFLGSKYGTTFKFHARNVREIVKLLSANFKGFQKDLLGHKPGYKIIVDKEFKNESELENPTVGKIVHIVPSVVGAGKYTQIIVAVALIVGGSIGKNPTLVNTGFAMLFSGVSALLFAPKPPDRQSQDSDKVRSFNFNGPVNTTSQGNCVPVLYGKLMVGSQIISAGMRTQQINPLTGVYYPIAENQRLYATWSPFETTLDYDTSLDSKTITKNSVNLTSAKTLVAKSTGKWYFEVLVNQSTPDAIIGLSDNLLPILSSCGSTSGSVLIGPSSIIAGASFATPQGTSLIGTGLESGGTFTVGIAVDFDNNKLWVVKNNVWLFTGNPELGTNPTITWAGFESPLQITQSSVTNGSVTTINAGQGQFVNTPPAGFNFGWYS